MVGGRSQNNEGKDKRPKKSNLRTKKNNDIRESRKNQYTTAKTVYQASIWKEIKLM